VSASVRRVCGEWCPAPGRRVRGTADGSLAPPSLFLAHSAVPGAPPDPQLRRGVLPGWSVAHDSDSQSTWRRPRRASGSSPEGAGTPPPISLRLSPRCAGLSMAGHWVLPWRAALGPLGRGGGGGAVSWRRSVCFLPQFITSFPECIYFSPAESGLAWLSEPAASQRVSVGSLGANWDKVPSLPPAYGRPRHSKRQSRVSWLF
jgi:hypothetical protein